MLNPWLPRHLIESAHLTGLFNLVGIPTALEMGWAHDVTGSYVVGLVPWCLGSLVLAAGGWMLPETGPRERFSAGR